MKITVFEAFAGYGSQCMALERLKSAHSDFDYELVGWSEIDKNAIKLHDACHPDGIGKNYGDITKIDWASVPNFDLFTYSFPCQSISSAGLQHGFAEGSGTRSSLLWECRKVVKAKHPKYMLMENVKALLQEKFRPVFRLWEQEVAKAGYDNYVKVLNAADYNVPQARERVFMVSIRRDDNQTSYFFPNPVPLAKSVKDILEDSVDDSYYLSDKMLDYFERVTADKTHNHNFRPVVPDGGRQTFFSLTTHSCDRVDGNFIKE